MKNKFLALFMAISLLMGFIPSGAETETKVDYSSEITFLKKAKVLPDRYQETKEITRGEFAQILISVLYPDGDFSSWIQSETMFSDVDSTNKYYAYIKACKDLKIVSGDGKNHFRPNDSLLATEAITMLVNALGYQIYANAEGGYLTGYLSVAKRIGLTKGVSYSATSPLTGGDAAKMVYNALFADLVELVSIVNQTGTPAISKERTLLSERLGIVKMDAIVVDNGVTALSQDSIYDFERVILRDYKTGTNLQVYAKDSDLAEHLGSRVIAYIKENRNNGRNEIFHYEIHNNAKEIIVLSKSILNVSEQYIEYEESYDSEKTIKLNFEKISPMVIYNGVRLNDYDISLFKPKEGMLRVIDQDGNGRYEFVEIISLNYQEGSFQAPARNILVNYADNNDAIITCKWNIENNLSLPENETAYRFIFSEDHKTLNDLYEGEVLSVAEAPQLINGKKFYYLMVANEYETITPTSKDDKMLFEEEQAYSLSETITAYKPYFMNSIVLNQAYGASFNALGYIAFIKIDQENTQEYAYLINGKLNNMGDVLILRVFTKEGHIRDLEVANHARIDGVSKKNAEEQLKAVAKRPEGGNKLKDAFGNYVEESLSRPVILKLNQEDHIIDIETDNPNDLDSSKPLSSLYEFMTHIPYTKEEAENQNTLKAGYRSPRNISNTLGGMYCDNMFLVSNESEILAVPDIDTYGLDVVQNYVATRYQTDVLSAYDYNFIKLYELAKEDHNYKVLTRGDLSTSYNYDIQGYNIDPETNVAQLVVIRGERQIYRQFSVPTGGAMFAFRGLSEYYDEETETMMHKLYYTQDGRNEESVIADFDHLPFYNRFIALGAKKGTHPFGEKDLLPLKRGDIIRFIAVDGRITHLEQVCEIRGELTNLVSSTRFPSTAKAPYSARTNCDYTIEESWYNNSYLQIMYAKQVQGGFLRGLVGYGKLSAINPNNRSTYILKLFSMGAAPILTVNLNSDGTATIKNGNATDIKTLDEVGGDIKRASILMVKQSNQNIQQIIVINKSQEVEI